ncbi:unnamed protein product [Ambrosiozyma monospora]|uniref:Unnamed protein product n=1 Tax=Ambrosiozyma monospora TaxID=43982 RepID=A0ACB5SU18_AMBMO|nr:unnamed protein product [Ambrosiozyma monospora]
MESQLSGDQLTGQDNNVAYVDIDKRDISNTGLDLAIIFGTLGATITVWAFIEAMLRWKGGSSSSDIGSFDDDDSYELDFDGDDGGGGDGGG